ncbi:MBL fold metallo-hydrolase, partial [Brevibacterium casei]
MAAIEHVVTSGTFSLDGGTWDVDNNVWIVGDGTEVIVIDPAHDVDAIAEAVGSREVKAVLLTHGHDDHVGVVREFAQRVGNPPVYLNPEDYVLWDMTYEDYRPEGQIADGDTWTVGGVTLRALHTPGHSPGSTSFFIETGL